MKSYRDDVRARAAAQGRNPDDIKVLFVVSPVLGTTEEEAWARKKASAEDPAFFEQSLASISSVTDIDFSRVRARRAAARARDQRRARFAGQVRAVGQR